MAAMTGIDDDAIDYAIYSALPSPYSVQRFGRGVSNEIALTFDDGQNGDTTERLLDLLLLLLR